MLPGMGAAMAGLSGAQSIEKTLANATLVNLQALFTADEWAAPVDKTVKIPAGVIIGSNAVGTPALRSGSGWGGILALENAGEIQGAGGAANSGVGGTALLADAPGLVLVLNNTGAIRSGGGGAGQGGQGGQGGPGYYQTPRTVTEGPYYNENTYWKNSDFYNYEGYVVWFGTTVAANLPQYQTSFNDYYRGNLYASSGIPPNIIDFYYIYRQYTVYDTYYTTGGASGAGGRGQGYGQSNLGGSGGAGAAGGLAGYALQNSGNITLTNTGTIQGRT